MLKKILSFTLFVPSLVFAQVSDDGTQKFIESRETASERTKRINDRFGDAASAVILIEDTEVQKKDLSPEEVRANLDLAKRDLEKISARGISRTKKRQLADSWNRLVRAEKELFGDTPNVIAWLRVARDLNPDNEEVIRALQWAEEKEEIANRRIKEAEQLRAIKNNR